MRTKTLLLTAALVAAGVATSMAQTVYSVNAVGYVNKTLVPGYNLVANPLNTGANGLQEIIPTPTDDLTVLIFDSGLQSFDASKTSTSAGGVWYDPGFNAPRSPTINPGTGIFISNDHGVNVAVTFVGEVPQGTLTTPIVVGYNLISSKVPQQGAMTGAGGLGFTAVVDEFVLTFNATAPQHYNAAKTYVGIDATYTTGWADDSFNPTTPPVLDVAEGAFLFAAPAPSPAPVAWTRTFSVSP